MDSVGKLSVETDLYAYVGNDPINWIDPLGLSRIQNGLIYDDNGNLIDEVGLEDPNPFLDPVNYLGGLGGAFMKGRFLYPRWQGTGNSDFIIKWPRGFKTRFDITKPKPHKWPHIHWCTKN